LIKTIKWNTGSAAERFRNTRKKNKDYVQTNKHTQARIDKQAQIGY